jgi:hypothetical protein
MNTSKTDHSGKSHSSYNCLNFEKNPIRENINQVRRLSKKLHWEGFCKCKEIAGWGEGEERELLLLSLGCGQCCCLHGGSMHI